MNETQTATATQTMPATIPGTELAPSTEVTTALVAYEQADDAQKQQIESIINEIDMNDRSSIMFFGTKTQEQMNTIS